MNQNALLVFVCLVFGESSARHISAEARIINGEQALLGQFPWQAALVIADSSSLRAWFCSGSIINEQWILTAAHCANSAHTVSVKTGLIDITDTTLSEVVSTEFYVHEEFAAETLANDIALVKLPTPLQFDDNTQPIQLSWTEVEVGTRITVSGWGSTSGNTTTVQAYLNYVNLTTISNEDCQQAYGTTGLIFPEMVCAATDLSSLRSPCHGDSGGPIVVDFESDPRQVAVASFVSDRGCESGFPSGYTRTAYYRDWIWEKTGVYV